MPASPRERRRGGEEGPKVIAPLSVSVGLSHRATRTPAPGSCDTEEGERGRGGGREQQSKGAAATAKFSRKIILAGGATAARKDKRRRSGRSFFIPLAHAQQGRQEGELQATVEAAKIRGGTSGRTQGPLSSSSVPSRVLARRECIFTTNPLDLSSRRSRRITPARVVHDRPRQRESAKGHRNGSSTSLQSVTSRALVRSPSVRQAALAPPRGKLTNDFEAS